MSAPLDTPPDLASTKYLRPQSAAYYALSLPAVISEVLFSQTIASNPQAITPPIAVLGPLIIQIIQLLPWIILAASIYALLSFRPSTLVTLLTASFFVLTITLGQVSYYNSALVVAAAFSALMGFNHARAAKVLGRRKLNLESHGPIGPRVASLGFDLLLPLAAALGLMTLVAIVIAGIQAQVRTLPEPLATLGGLYLSSHIYLVSTIITVAGAAIWAMRQMVEPVVMLYTMTRQDAVTEALRQVGDAGFRIKKDRKIRISRGMFWVSLLTLVLALTYTILTGQVSKIADSMLSILGVGGTSPSPSERLVEGYAKNLVRQVDLVTARVEGFVRFIIRLLWG